MGKPLNADWNLAQALIIQGLGLAEVAREVGVPPETLRKRAQRKGWFALRDKSIAKVAVTVPSTHGKSLAERADRVRNALATELEQAVEVLPTLPHSRSLKGFKGRQEAVRELTRNAAVVFGWGEQDQPRSPINLAVLTLSPEAHAVPEGVQVEVRPAPWLAVRAQPMVEVDVSEPTASAQLPNPAEAPAGEAAGEPDASKHGPGLAPG